MDRGKRAWKGVYVPGPHAGSKSQRVIVKTEPAKAQRGGFRSWPGNTKAYLRYLQREGKTVDHEPVLYTREGRTQHIAGFAERTKGDPHQFRIVLSPEHGHGLDMRTFTRQFMGQVEKDVTFHRI